MVKKLLVFGLMLILFSTFIVSDSHLNLIESYEFDFEEENITLTVDNTNSVEDVTTITFSFSAMPGLYNISSALGDVSNQEEVLFDDYQNSFVVEYQGVLPGQNDLVVKITNDQGALVAFKKFDVLVETDIEVSYDKLSVIVDEDKFYVVLDINTNFDFSTTSLEIISGNGVVYQNIDYSVTNEGKHLFTFMPLENSKYTIFSLSVDDFVLEGKTEEFGPYEFGLITGFSEEKTEEGLMISFVNKCDDDCLVEVFVFSTSNEYVYNTTSFDGDAVLIPSETITASMISAPYKIVFVTSEDLVYEYLTQEYDYASFEEEIVEEVIVEEVVDEQTTTSNGGGSIDVNISIVEETNETTTEEVIVEEVADDEVLIDIEEVNITEDVVISPEDFQLDKDLESNKTSVFTNLATGFANIKIPGVGGLSKELAGLFALLVVIVGVLIFVYIRQQKKFSMYEM
ncbi:hypothetical protein GOV05_04780 [Candidatus Woesearchaeota archaeon]|nr:hypothetical protein [Candidatus Woesearchaeota archaeon]